MARCRLVRPEFFTHEELHAAEVASGYPLRVAYAGLWCIADREGRFKWKPGTLKLAILPYDPVDFEDVLMALVATGNVESYIVDGKRYGWIPTFLDHQTPHHREPPSVLPAPHKKKAGAKSGPSPVPSTDEPRASLTDTETVAVPETETEAVAVTESDTEVKASAQLPCSPFSALGPNGGESPEEKRIRMRAGLAALMRGSATTGIPGDVHPKIFA